MSAPAASALVAASIKAVTLLAMKFRAIDRPTVMLLAPVPDSATPHALRHSFATHLVEAGVAITVVKMLLGHRSLQTTANYLHVSAERMAQLPSPLDSIKP